MTREQKITAEKAITKYIQILAFLHHKTLADVDRSLGQKDGYLKDLIHNDPDKLTDVIPHLLPSIYNELKLGDRGPFDDIVQQTSAKVHDKESFYRYLKVLACINSGSLAHVCQKLGYRESSVHYAIKHDDKKLISLCESLAKEMKLSSQFLTLPLKMAE